MILLADGQPATPAPEAPAAPANDGETLEATKKLDLALLERLAAEVEAGTIHHLACFCDTEKGEVRLDGALKTQLPAILYFAQQHFAGMNAARQAQQRGAQQIRRAVKQTFNKHP